MQLNVTVYKTVLRGLFTAMLSTFSAEQIIAGIPTIDPLVESYSCVFKEEIDLSERFIRLDFKDGAKASLLNATMGNFPAVLGSHPSLFGAARRLRADAVQLPR